MAVLLLRHGPTALNSPHAAHDRIRGWIDLPLSPEGVQVAQKAAEDLKTAPMQHIFSSDLQRASTTAQALSQASGVPMSTHMELRPWNLGAIQGQHSNDAKPVIDRLVANPDTPAPGGGETFKQFLGRYLPFIAPLVADPHLYGVVSHIRNVKALEAWLAHPERTALDQKTWDQAPMVQPGDAIIATMQGMEKA